MSDDLSLLEAIKIFGPDLEPVLEAKRADLTTQHKWLSKTLKNKRAVAGQRLDQLLGTVISKEDRELYHLFVWELTAPQLERRVVEVETELGNILKALNLFRATFYKRPNKKGLKEEDIAYAKEYPITRLYEGRLKKAGKLHRGLCPFHDEKTPSFFIWPDNSFYCFSCQRGGDAIDFIRELKDLSFREAVKQLR